MNEYIMIIMMMLSEKIKIECVFNMRYGREKWKKLEKFRKDLFLLNISNTIFIY